MPTFQEPEELKGGKESTPEIVAEVYNPLTDEAVNEKTYSRPSTAGIDQKDLLKDIPEPSFIPPPPPKPEQPKVAPQPKKPQEPINTQMNDLNKGDKKKAAAHVAGIIMKGYEWMHQGANKSLMISDRTIQKLREKDEVDFNIQIPFGYDEVVTAGEFLQSYNEQCNDFLTVSKEFKEDVTPVLERVLEKRGIGATDEQYLLVMFAKDMGVKTFMYFAQKNILEDVISGMKQQTAAYRNYAGNQSSPPPPPKPTAPVPPEPLQPQASETAYGG
jgi:hypothetical protein